MRDTENQGSAGRSARLWGRAAVADVDHRQQAEHQRLHAAGKHVKIQAQDAGNAHLQIGHPGKPQHRQQAGDGKHNPGNLGGQIVHPEAPDQQYQPQHQQGRSRE